MRRIGIAILAASLGSLALAQSASADTTPEDKAAADALFAEAGKLAKENKWAEACPKLEASIKLDAAIGALFHLAECYEKTNRPASAWTTLHDAYDLAKKANDKRMKDAEDGANRIEPSLGKIVLTVRADVQPADLEVRRDGTLLARGALGVPVPLDPGEHVIEASASGKQTWRQTLRIPAGPGITTVEIPPLVDVPAALGGAGGARTRFWGAQRIAGVTVGSAGLTGLLLAAAFGGVSIVKRNGLASDCHGGNPEMCNAAGVELHDQALTMANASNVALAVGGGALISGVAIFLTAPRGVDSAAKLGDPSVVSITAGVGSLQLSGRW
jgi:hypothetical protein